MSTILLTNHGRARDLDGDVVTSGRGSSGSTRVATLILAFVDVRTAPGHLPTSHPLASLARLSQTLGRDR
jgi:hypothetical protein